MIPNINNKRNIRKKTSLNQNNANNINTKKTKKKNLILECSYNNKQFNNQFSQTIKPHVPNKNINLNQYNMKDNSFSDASSQNTIVLSSRQIVLSSRHSKSKSLVNNDMDLFENRLSHHILDNMRNMNKYHHNLSYKNFRIFSLKNSNNN